MAWRCGLSRVGFVTVTGGGKRGSHYTRSLSCCCSSLTYLRAGDLWPDDWLLRGSRFVGYRQAARTFAIMAFPVIALYLFLVSSGGAVGKPIFDWWFGLKLVWPLLVMNGYSPTSVNCLGSDDCFTVGVSWIQAHIRIDASRHIHRGPALSSYTS